MRGRGLIGYYDETGGALRIAHCDNAECSAASTRILDDTVANVGRRSSTTIGPEGLGIVAYVDATNGDLKMARCRHQYC